MATSDVVICNLALSHIGADAVLSSINPPDGSVEAGYCARYYPVARQELIEMHAWGFAKTRVALAALSVNPSATWTYAYEAPSDMIQSQRILTTSTLDAYGFFPFGGLLRADEVALFSERGSANFDIEDGVVLTHEPDAVLLYTHDVIDTSKFTAGFTSALSFLVASYLAGPLIKGAEGTNAALKMRQVAERKAAQAAANDANSSVESSGHVPEHIRRRA
jgi:hypothetical protein